ncbi:hypothetical protein B0J13DRAFT_221598 [Dactylonectria estremocensis]|uniref:Uncharacterized protein n=1 Tax=Dactylonectria estremocensis TaxID=1079267 RepID=A0A9P9J7H7_9HYPO|nr:hypothetical protein B0J13DRAFT_221598 [Dactylonectria estremocensis]
MASTAQVPGSRFCVRLVCVLLRCADRLVVGCGMWVVAVKIIASRRAPQYHGLWRWRGGRSLVGSDGSGGLLGP